MISTGNEVADFFLKELDRRIESPDSEHDEESKDRLRKIRAPLAILAAGDPERFARLMATAYREVTGSGFITRSQND